ncbi:sulfurtransferase complex subunit TusB [Shewanella sp. 1_MG-2023]|uniref:sulfurtransferase complex subunit TusB n=1 Tax=unclassified Shewanella TaxID=196818 RepID=UPI000C8559EB|nr:MULTISPECIES: sulfurtransferase complex subunit TusB [unclassified Shewanella]MCC4832833.1 sulfurtransferase complex subunit TusB [Shewanella sp. 10N.7]MDO6611031.1 sulfurtransferase complex subunit TusB [Shewanella sp. 7_MG-2023]MDO6770118.1 sulfurtransferase complex subunit TusB [Shewanella sp. 2_MG-2023]MDO6794770.1 sulfurtransferase complex subunit TusB [Shewanella sp. 1_MG-2023]PMG80401.1 sulfur relay protein DsrH [Shewanella sp. 10N.286.51.B7]
MILHHIQSSVTADNALNTCLRYIDAQDSILLADDALNCLLNTQWQQRLADFKLYVLIEDIEARGLSERLPQSANISIIDYDQFVLATLQHTKVITW